MFWLVISPHAVSRGLEASRLAYFLHDISFTLNTTHSEHLPAICSETFSFFPHSERRKYCCLLRSLIGSRKRSLNLSLFICAIIQKANEAMGKEEINVIVRCFPSAFCCVQWEERKRIVGMLRASKQWASHGWRSFFLMGVRRRVETDEKYSSEQWEIAHDWDFVSSNSHISRAMERKSFALADLMMLRKAPSTGPGWWWEELGLCRTEWAFYVNFEGASDDFLANNAISSFVLDQWDDVDDGRY